MIQCLVRDDGARCYNARPARTVEIVARSSAVEGQRDSNGSPEPPQAPSYTPGIVLVESVGMSNAKRILEARVDKDLVVAGKRDARRILCIVDLALESIGGGGRAWSQEDEKTTKVRKGSCL